MGRHEDAPAAKDSFQMEPIWRKLFMPVNIAKRLTGKLYRAVSNPPVRKLLCAWRVSERELHFL